MAFATCFSLYALPASADYISSENFGSWVTRNSPEFIQRWTHGFFGAGCTVSDDGRHHASSFQTDLGTGYYDCICSECGHSFRAYYQDSYDQSVSELPAGTVTSNGSFYWQPVVSDFNYLTCRDSIQIIQDGVSVLNQYCTPINDYSWHFSYSVSDKSSIYFPATWDGFSLNLPLTGTYTFAHSLVFTGAAERRGGWAYTEYKYFADDVAAFTQNYPISFSGSSGSTYVRTQSNAQSLRVTFIDAVYSLPSFYITPSDPIDIYSGDTYNIDNRVGSLVGNYTYEGDNGTQIIAEDIRIVNETDHSVYNPVTNETYYYNEYTYNYGDRSYDFSFGDRDDHVSVTYGDDCVTIEDGDHTYTIYYTTGTNCSHTYEVSRVVDPTCVDCGYTYRTCTLCGDEQVTEIPPIGHDWVVVEQTQHDLVLPDDSCPECDSNYFTPELDGTTFHCYCNDCGHDWDQEADVSEYGHVTYECTRCGAQRTEDNTAPTFWDWWREQWYEFKAWYQSLSFNHSDPAFPDDPDSDDPSFNDVANDSRRSLWEILLKLFKNLNGIFDETGDAVDGLNVALSEPEDDTSVWYIFDVPYEYMSPVGEGD